jgi:hypothetical protein
VSDGECRKGPFWKGFRLLSGGYSPVQRIVEQLVDYRGKSWSVVTVQATSNFPEFEQKEVVSDRLYRNTMTCRRGRNSPQGCKWDSGSKNTPRLGKSARLQFSC